MTHSIIDSIGNTPLVEIRHMNPVPGVTILAKLEYLNPGGSIKDRAALSMIEQGEESGELCPGKTVIEATSGNTGIGLAMICSIKGYPLLLTMSESASQERKSILRARGAEIRLTPGHLGSDGAIEEVYRLARENPDVYFMTDQYNNPANWLAHYRTTAPEIWEQTCGKVTSVVAALGTSGTLMGISRRLKELNPLIRIIAAEPFLGHGIQGLKNMKESYIPDLFDKKRLDEKINIDDETAFETARMLAKKEGLFVGMSSGAAMAVALAEAAKIKKGTVVVIFPDGGERYLSTSLFKVKDNINLSLYNTLTRSCERFQPKAQGKASIYTCGPTVHKAMDPTRFRRFVATDLLVRYLEYRGLGVNHVVNITDLDDQTIRGSEHESLTVPEFTRPHIETFKGDLNRLGIRPAQAYPLVSENIQEMVAVTERLVEQGFAYEKLNSVYFGISSLEGYGSLSGVDLDKIRVGATVDLDDYAKDNPRDFTLLKRVGLSELKRGVCVRTKWGNVRPSLHLQCTALSMKYLGAGFDIHTGSKELLFPHHENENAMSRALTGQPLARIWMHCDSVIYDGTLEEKNLGEIDLDLLERLGWQPRVVRFLLLSCHYRKPLTFSREALYDAERGLDRFDRFIEALYRVRGGEPFEELPQLLYELHHGFVTSMDEDLKISGVLAVLFKGVKTLNSLMAENRIDQEGAARVLAMFREIDRVLNIFEFKPGNEVTCELSSDVSNLIEKRTAARACGNFVLADRLRDEIKALGVQINDKKA
ncbi:MAG: cysteine synthase [Desulfobacterium sp.]|jgi:cysteinyl-tRNA synthetase|nr:cysteine synthase [Desulfobacterium sp.]